MAASLYAGIDKYFYWINMPMINLIDVIEIIIIAVVIYNLMAWIKNTRAWTLLKGIIFILLFLLLAAICQMSTIVWLASKLANLAAIALVIIFQPELRTALESLGRKNILTSILGKSFSREDSQRFSEKTIAELVKACYEMGRAKTGALIVIERNERLNEFIRTGILLDSMISSQLLLNIFEHNTPLHDGAVVVRENRVVAATCYLPLSDNRALSKDLGTRHRAAVGISEVSDSVTIVVSEENGGVSLAKDGMLYRQIEPEFLKEQLHQAALLEGQNELMRDRMKKKLYFTIKKKRRLQSVLKDAKRRETDAKKADQSGDQ